MMKQKETTKSRRSILLRLFDLPAHVLYRAVRRLGVGEVYFAKMQQRLLAVCPTKEGKTLLEQYICNKLAGALLFAAAGGIIVVLSVVLSVSEQELGSLQRQDYWGEDETYGLLVETGEWQENLDVKVSHRQMEQETLQKFLQKKAQELPQMILGHNLSVDEIFTDLQLIQQIPGTQIDVFWEVEENDCLSADGSVMTAKLNREGQPVCLTATLYYEELSVSTSFYVNVVLPELSEKQQLLQSVGEEIAKVNEKTVSEDSLVLPKQVNGKAVRYLKAETAQVNWWLLVLPGICPLLWFFAQDERLQRQMKKRERQMMIDYPELVNKLTLYLGAGMTAGGALEKLSADYIQRRREKRSEKRFAYEEMVYLCREVQGGVGIRTAIEHLAARCGLQPYRKLCMLLSQNLKKGSGELSVLLHTEAVSAFEQRKSMARRLGEEAGTKLLLPMVLMLCIVLIILIVPAWLSFQF